MAARGMSYAEKFSRWDLLVTNAKLDTEQLPHLADDLASLETLLTQARTIESRQEDLRSQARGMNADLRKIAQDGEKLRSRLGASMQGKFGFASETLVKFGFKPRRTPRRARSTEPTTGAKAKAGTPADADASSQSNTTHNAQ